MVKVKEEVVDLATALKRVSSQLKSQATRPNIYGYTPHAKQVPFHNRSTRHALYIGGNRAGKTVAGICEDIMWLTGRHPFIATPPPPVRGRIVGVDFNNGIEKILRPELARWMPLSELKGGSWDTAYSKAERTLYLENGSFVEFMSYDQDVDKFAGTSRHFVHFDEEPPEDIFQECRTRLIDTGGSWWMTLTPIQGMQWIYDDIYMKGKEDPEANISVIEVDMLDNPHLNRGEVEEFISSLDEDDRKSRVHGKFVQRGGLIFKEFNKEIHVVDFFVPPKEWLWIASLDHGYTNPTAWLWHAVSPDGEVVTFQEHYASKVVVEEHAAAVHRINTKLGRPPEQYIGDPSIRNTQPITGTSIQQEYIKYGVPVTLGNNDVSAGLERINGYLRVRDDGRPNWHITRNCENLIYEMGRYTWKVWANRKVAGLNNLHETPRKKEDHAIDSARYFFMSRPDLKALIPGAAPKPVNWLGASTPVDPGDSSIWTVQAPAESDWYVDEDMGGYY